MKRSGLRESLSLQMKRKNRPGFLILRGLFAVLVLAVLGRTALGEGETYRFDPSHSIISFKVHQFLGTTRGRFTRFEGKIYVDRDHPARSSVWAKIRMESIDTGIATRDRHLRAPDFFNAAKYPEITFKSRSVKQTGRESADIVGNLSMHGVSRPVTLHVRLIDSLKRQALTLRTRWNVTMDPIQRRNFGLLWSPGVEAISMISQEVFPRIEIEAVRAE
jgi:polyisoprenoid-binding protein YceI